ncbi:MAG: NAD(P)/FAD-dependent oxidoreductase, partial [Lachnospiraceae bacterium]|nr:NAD(P)/FAD-dependent oxidoreductase [Lachnospiraceae bacterium]
RKAERMLPKGLPLLEMMIVRHSVDARKKPQLLDVYTVDIVTGKDPETERKALQRSKDRRIAVASPRIYSFPASGTGILPERPVVIGAGPAGLFCALYLAEHGYRPVLLERGKPVEERTKDVEWFWKTGVLDPASNCQFGEGGAGTFSDGKLTTLVNDPDGRSEEILRRFVEFGAPEEILYEGRPHIGTDRLRTVIIRLRRAILEAGGDIRYQAEVTGLEMSGGAVRGVRINGREILPASVVVLAPGHSARDTIRQLYADKVPMEQKAFAVGFRVIHPQSLIDFAQYGVSAPQEMQRLHLEASSYKLTAKAASGRGVYSFCMCPGGYVVNASSEPGRLCVNGMSDYARDSGYANSAIVMTVGGADFGSDHPLSGMAFQEKLEEECYRLGRGAIPIESYPDFEKGISEQGGAENEAKSEETRLPQIRGACRIAPVHKLLPDALNRDFCEGMRAFDRHIPGYAENALVAGLESRTSCPVRIVRNEDCESTGLRGLYPCGEGAGYAGGIMSAAMDGIRIAEKIAVRYAPVSD